MKITPPLLPPRKDLTVIVSLPDRLSDLATFIHITQNNRQVTSVSIKRNAQRLNTPHSKNWTAEWLEAAAKLLKGRRRFCGDSLASTAAAPHCTDTGT
jgi:hypothetical protein